MLLFVLLLIELVLLFMGLLFGRLLGYETALASCFWLGVIVALCAASIFVLNLASAGLWTICSKLGNRCGKGGRRWPS